MVEIKEHIFAPKVPKPIVIKIPKIPEDPIETRKKQMENLQKAHQAEKLKSKVKLTIKNQKFVKEYTKTGLVSKSVQVAYPKMNKKSSISYGNRLLSQPKIQKEITIALNKYGLDSDYALNKMQKLIEAGQDNLENTQPKDVLKALEMILKLKGLLGGRVVDENSEERLQEKVAKLGISEIEKELKELDKNQKRLLNWAETGAEEGEVVNESK